MDELWFAALDVDAALRHLRERVAGWGEELRVRWFLLDAAEKQALLAIVVTVFVTAAELAKARVLGDD